MAGTHYILELEGNKRPQNQDLGVRTNDFEDWILANFCVIAGLSTIGFVVRYWYQVIALTLQSFFYWTCTMSGLWLLLCLLKRAMSYYRKVKGLKHEGAWGVLISVNVLRFYNRFEGCHADGVPGLLLDAGRVPFELLKFLVNSIGFKLGKRKRIHEILTIKKNPLFLRRLMNGSQILLSMPIYDLSIPSQQILILSWSRVHHWKAVAWI
ncbi:unnamed protein product [Alternaria alternata]